MKKICSLFLIVVLLITGAGCTSSKNSNSTHTKITPRSIFSAQPIQTEPGALNGIPINNTMSLEQALTTAYPLSQLEEFFGTYSRLEWSYYDSETALPQEKSWNQAHSLVAAVEHFPVQLLRYTEVDGDPQAYSIFRIMEGGFYYVFWYEDEEDPDIDTGEGLYVCRDSMYLNDLPSQEDFESLIIGQSSLEDVCKLDSGTLIEFTPNFYRSYHILDNGLGISALYERNHNAAPRNRQDLILTDLSVIVDPCWILQSHLLTSDIPLDWRTSSSPHEITLSAKLTTAPETLQEKFSAQACLPQHLIEQNILIDNTTPLKQALTTSYSLDELDTFFRSFSRQEIPPSDQTGYFINLGTSPTLAQANLKFPIEVLRCTNHPEAAYTYYSVYQVREGGYYYVFWNYSSTENPPFYYCSTFYLNGYFYREDFSQLTVGQNTLADVYTIDPTLTLQRYADQRYFSTHLLEDGNVLSLYYTPISETDADISAENLVITDLAYGELNPNNFSVGYGILFDDLP